MFHPTRLSHIFCQVSNICFEQKHSSLSHHGIKCCSYMLYSIDPWVNWENFDHFNEICSNNHILDFYKLLRVCHHRHLSLQLSRQLPLDLQGHFKAIATTAMFMGTRLQTAAKSNLFKFTVGIYMETLTLLSTVYVLWVFWLQLGFAIKCILKNFWI